LIRYVIKRILWLIPIIIVVTFIMYFLLDLAPGTVVDQMRTGNMTEEEIQQLYKEYDLDKSVFYRYGKYMLNLVQGDLGTSQITQTSVWKEFSSRFINTFVLSISGMIIGCLIALPLGIFASKRAGTLWDTLTTGFTLIGMSMPNFWVGMLLIIVFAYKIPIFKANGSGGLAGGLAGFILPAITTSFTMMATVARQVRSSMLENIRADYLRTARAKGVPERDVINRHALKNAWIPVITTIGTTLTMSMAGSAVIETVFSWPGIGKLVVDAVSRRDVTLASGCIVLTTILYVVLLLIVDLLYAAVDPRIKAQYVSGAKKKKKTAQPAKGVGI